MTNSAVRTKRPYLDRGNSLARHVQCALPLHEGAGLAVHDISGRGRHGTLTNWPVWQQSAVGNVIDFDGTDDHIPLGTSIPQIIAAKNRVSVVCRCESDSLVGGDTELQTIGRYLVGNSRSANDCQLVMGFGNNNFVGGVDGASSSRLVKFAWPTGTYTNVAMTWDGLSLHLYFDGTLVNSDTTGAMSIQPTVANGLAIGTKRVGGVFNSFNGRLNYIAFFDCALSPSQVRELHRNPNYLWGPPQRLAPYLIQEAGGGTVVDHTGILMRHILC